MRLSRACYDKFHRCPGWAGGGLHYPKGDDRCDNGHIRFHDGDGDPMPLWWLRFLPCDTCDVVVWPHATRWLDPSWVVSVLRWHGLFPERRPTKGGIVEHVPEWLPADLPIDADGNTRPGFECGHELENGMGRCGGNVFDLTDAVGPHCCFVPAGPDGWRRAVASMTARLKGRSK